MKEAVWSKQGDLDLTYIMGWFAVVVARIIVFSAANFYSFQFYYLVEFLSGKKYIL